MKHPIVLIHGLFGNLSEQKIITAFGNAAVYAPDLLGYGQFKQADLSSLTLADQANHIARFIETHQLGAVHLVGHSVGGAVAVLVASLYPHLAASLTSVEGNFTLKDAFWSGQLAKMPLAEVEEIISGYAKDPTAWITKAGVQPSAWATQLATCWLSNQPASTIKAQAKAVVEATEVASYLETVKQIIHNGLAVNLIAGARSVEGWDVPVWAYRLATMKLNLPNTGHLLMAEAPEQFAQVVLMCAKYAESLQNYQTT
ncbi:MAG: alpha/beta fold hydrolase [Thiothrix sp.]|nr:MAG: alpha/beta fold hydrolase [Thiothrix sp.]